MTTIIKNKGFTLAEIAIVVLIIGIALSMGLKLATAKVESAAISETKSKQDLVKLALLSFLRTNGRLPCPDNSAAIPTGIETTPCSAAPVNGYGVLPWQTLGISQDSVLDGWGNFFSYRVSTAAAVVAAPFAPTPLHRFNNQNWTIHAAGGFDIRSYASAPAAPGFQSILIQNRTPGPALTTEARNVIVVILSHGKNGFGAKTTRAAARIAGAANDEAVNATLGSTTFINRPYSENAPVGSGGPYDDIVAYLTPQDLLQPLISEKTLLGVCSSYCTGGGPTPCSTTTPIPIGAPLTPATGLACP